MLAADPIRIVPVPRRKKDHRFWNIDADLPVRIPGVLPVPDISIKSVMTVPSHMPGIIIMRELWAGAFFHQQISVLCTIGLHFDYEV